MKTLFFGGKILTMEDPLYAEAVLVENGRILAVGEEAAIRADNDGFAEIDLGGATLLPGFIDTHGHFIIVATSMHQASVAGAASVAEMKCMLDAYVKANGVQKGEWVVATGYDENLLSGAKHPTLEELDALCPDNPLMIKQRTEHLGLINSLAMQVLGITAETPDPPSGIIDKKDGKPTGLLIESALSAYKGRVSSLSREQLVDGCIRAQEKYASFGITTAQEGYITCDTVSLYADLIAQDILKLDLITYPPASGYQQVKEHFDALPQDPRLRIGGMKSFIDGEPQIRSARMRKPYADGSFGLECRTFEHTCNQMRLAVQYNTQIIIHTQGDAGVDRFLDCLETVAKEHPKIKELRPVIIHASLMQPDQMERAARLGAIPSFFMSHPWHWGDLHIQLFGMERAKTICPTRSALEHGVRFTFHQDAPVAEPNILELVWCAANRVTRNGVHLDGEQISVLDALKAVTSDAAYQYFEEDSKGTVAVGKRADFVVLEKDPLAVSKEDIRDIRILATYKGGECIYKQ